MKKLLPILLVILSACATDSILLKNQGSFTIGGVVLKNEAGKSFRADHGYVFYQIPKNAQKLPMVFAHGVEQFSKTWESTPDGRDGFANIFLKEKFSVYLMTQPRRGNAGRSSQKMTLAPDFSDEMWFNHFRIGIYPRYFEGVQFPRDKESLNQFLRQSTPTIAPKHDLNLYAETYAALLNKIGDSILITHSQGGDVGWRVAQKTDHIRALVAYEPGGNLPFPKGQMPELGKTLNRAGEPEGIEIPKQDFLRFTRFPIVIYFGDFIPETPSDSKEYPLSYAWRVRLELARLWADIINQNGGDATVVHLPEIGLKGNTHFPFSDLNNAQVAQVLKQWLIDHNLLEKH